MIADINTELTELAALVAAHAPEGQIVQKAHDIKSHLFTTSQELGLAVKVVDSLVAAFAPNHEWQQGLSTSASSGPQRMIRSPKPVSRGTGIEAVLRIASEMASKEGVVTSKQVAKRLRAEGDSRPERSIMISVGNILAKDKAWRKIRPGEYVAKEKAGEQKVLIQT